VGYADLRRGAAVRDLLEAELDAGDGRLRGVRHIVTWDADKTIVNPSSAVPRGLLLDPTYRAGVAQLGPLSLSYDAWLFFPQLPELFDLAKAYPDTRFVVNHCDGVVRIASYGDQRKEVFDTWARSMRELAQLPNVYVKVGGLGMHLNGFDFEKGERPPSSIELAETWKPWVHTCIEAFGANRCMFESNFPVDKGSYPFSNGWNAFKRLTAQASGEDMLKRGEALSTRGSSATRSWPTCCSMKWTGNWIGGVTASHAMPTTRMCTFAVAVRGSW
jgi:L-fuconolactonase